MGQPLSFGQRLGLKLVSRLYGGRDVVFAMDLTDSVGLNAEGKIRLTQIIEDSLQSGDTVYVVPFASTVDPLEVNSFASGIEFRGKPEDIEAILSAVPFAADLRFSNTDIQRAEGEIYPKLAQLNQCRLIAGDGIKPQSVIWLTDAPLFADKGIDSQVWIETPRDSPFRQAESEESLDRTQWLEALPVEERSLLIQTDNDREYQLTVVDIQPTVQEFCTPSPGGKETCLVNGYLVRMLWLPALILLLSLTGLGVGLRYWLSLQKKYRIKARYESDDVREPDTCYLKAGEKIAIGGGSLNGVYCPGEDVRGYLIRRRNQIYLKPTKIAPLYYRDREVIKEELVSSNSLTLNCPEAGQDFLIRLQIIK